MSGETRDERMDKLAQLPDGWHNGKGKATSELAAANARKFMRAWPTPSTEGGIEFEETFGPWEISVEFHADGTVTTSTYYVPQGHA